MTDRPLMGYKKYTMNSRVFTAVHALTNRLDHWIFEEYRMPPRALSVFRIVYSAFVLLMVGVPPFRWIGNKPEIFYNPPMFSIMRWFDGYPAPSFFWLLDGGVTLLFVCLLFGFQTRWTSWLLALGLFTGFSWSYAYGKINHDTLLMALVPLVMSFSRWGAYFSLDQRRASGLPKQEQYWPVALLALLFGFAMFSAGMPKLLSGWLDPTTHAVQGYTIRQHYDFYADQLLAPIMAHFDLPWFWELLDYSAVLFEVGFLLAVAKRPVFQFFIVLTVIFHLTNSLMLNIDFSRNLTLYLLFIDWRPVMRWVDRHPKLQTYIRFSCLGGVSAFFVVYYLVGIPAVFRGITWLLGLDALSSGVVLVGLAAVLFSVNYLSSWSRVPEPVNS